MHREWIARVRRGNPRQRELVRPVGRGIEKVERMEGWNRILLDHRCP